MITERRYKKKHQDFKYFLLLCEPNAPICSAFCRISPVTAIAGFPALLLLAFELIEILRTHWCLA